MSPYIVSYIRNSSSPADLRYTSATTLFSFQIAGQGLSMVFGGILEKRMGPRLTTLLGGWLMSAGVALTYFTIRISFFLMLVTYGLMFGVGVGLAYIGPVSCAMKWLPKWKGLASGVIVAGFGLSAILFNTIQTAFINPTNEKPYSKDSSGEKYFYDSSMLEKVPYVFLLLGGTYAVMQFVGCIFLVNPLPKEVQNVPEYSPVPTNDLTQSDGNKEESDDEISLRHRDYQTSTDKKDDIEDSTKLSGDEEPLRSSRSSSVVASDLERSTVAWSSNFIFNLSPLKILKQPNFYILWIMFFCSGTSTAFISSLYKSYALSNNICDSDFLLTLTGSLSSVFNFLGRILWGSLADMTSYKLAFVLQGALASCLYLTFYATTEAGFIMYIIWVCGIFFCVGGYYSLFPTAIARSFGQENVSVNYGLLFTSQIAGGILAAFISHFLVDHIHWYGMLFIIAGLNCIEFLFAVCYRHKRLIHLRSPDDFHENASRIESSIKFPEEQQQQQ
jgi:MFS family permease